MPGNRFRSLTIAVRATTYLLTFQLLLTLSTSSCHAQDNAALKIHVTDEGGKLLPCRVHLNNSSGVAQKTPELPFWHDHFVCPGEATVELAPGEYSWQLERGPEFRPLSGKVVVSPGKTAFISPTLSRLVSLRETNWYSGDLHVHRAVSDIELLMSAEDLDFAPVIGWWNQPAPNARAIPRTEFSFGSPGKQRVYSVGAGEDEREGGALLYFGLKRPLDLTVKSRELPSPMQFVAQARKQNPNVWIEIEKPFWWDVPTWLAVAKPDSIGIAHNHMHRSGVLGNEAWGHPRNLDLFSGPHGNGLWTQQIYYHILNSGIRIPPSAGSASGVLPNPVGYNRVYVQLGESKLTRDHWFNALQEGRCFVTNGPLLRVTANGQWPGGELTFENDALLNLTIALDSIEPVSQLEVIHNGQVIQRIPCSAKLSQTLETTLSLPEPGWFLVRAIANVDHTFRFASTAPWYVSPPDKQPRVSRESTQFFLDWIEERIERIKQNVSNSNERDLVLRWHYQARDLWRKRHMIANAK